LVLKKEGEARDDTEDEDEDEISLAERNETDTAFTQLLIETVLPKIRQAVYKWTPRADDRGCMAAFVTSWKPVLTRVVFENIIG
jgi:hypothetical protein